MAKSFLWLLSALLIFLRISGATIRGLPVGVSWTLASTNSLHFLDDKFQFSLGSMEIPESSSNTQYKVQAALFSNVNNSALFLPEPSGKDMSSSVVSRSAGILCSLEGYGRDVAVEDGYVWTTNGNKLQKLAVCADPCMITIAEECNINMDATGTTISAIHIADDYVYLAIEFSNANSIYRVERDEKWCPRLELRPVSLWTPMASFPRGDCELYGMDGNKTSLLFACSNAENERIAALDLNDTTSGLGDVSFLGSSNTYYSFSASVDSFYKCPPKPTTAPLVPETTQRSPTLLVVTCVVAGIVTVSLLAALTIYIYRRRQTGYTANMGAQEMLDSDTWEHRQVQLDDASSSSSESEEYMP